MTLTKLNSLLKNQYFKDVGIAQIMMLRTPDADVFFSRAMNDPEKLHKTIGLIKQWEKAIKNVNEYYANELNELLS